MPIQNNIGLTGFTRNFHEPMEGQPSDMHGMLTRAYRNPLLGQINTITITGFGADADSVSVDITLPNGTVVSTTTTRAASVPVDDAAAAAALVVAINATAALNGHVVATSALGVLTLTFDQAGITYTVATRVTAAVATVAETQAAGGVTVPYGRFVAAGASVGGQPAIRALVSTDRDAQVRGVTVRPQLDANAGSILATAVDAIAIGSMCDMGYDGNVAMRNNSSVAAIPGGQVWAVVATTGGDAIGEARADASGALQVSTITPGAGQNSVTVAIEIRMLTGPLAGQSKILSYVTDATMTATEVADAFRVDLNADATWAAVLVDSGTTTLILTAATADSTWETNALEGTFTIDDATTAAALYAIPLDLRRFYWAEAVPANGVGQVMCRA